MTEITRIAIVGASGRMGKTLLEACAELDSVEVTVATEHPHSPLIGGDSGAIAGIGANGVLIASPQQDLRTSLYVRIGDWPARFCALASLIAIAAAWREK